MHLGIEGAAHVLVELPGKQEAPCAVFVLLVGVGALLARRERLVKRRDAALRLRTT